MAGPENNSETKGFMAWLDARLPVTQAFEKHMSKYYAPKNFNFWYEPYISARNMCRYTTTKNAEAPVECM